MSKSSTDAPQDVRREKGTCIFNFKDTPVKVVVGSSKDIFFIAPSVLCKPDNFFHLALQNKWKEGQEHTIELPEDDPTIFRIFAEWLYTGKIFCQGQGLTTERNYETLVELYIFGEKVQDNLLQRRVIDAMRLTHKENGRPPVHTTITRIYECTPPGSPIRALVVEWCVQHRIEDDPKARASMEESASREFLLDLLSASFKKRALTSQAKADLAARAGSPCIAYYHRAPLFDDEEL